jgi:hypothetical protein
MSQDEFTKLFKYLQEFRKDVETRFDKVDNEIRETKLSVGELAGNLKDYHQELLLLAHKVDRLERWIQQVAQKTGVTLEY